MMIRGGDASKTECVLLAIIGAIASALSIRNMIRG